MKESRFVELVNLYIDRQITPDEAAQLEAEMAANPGRRRVYRQYCQMHRASRLVHESFRAQAADPDSGAVDGSSGAIARLEVRQRRRRGAHWTYYVAGLAAAACLTLVAVRFAKHGGDSAPLALVAENTPAAMPAAEQAPDQMVAVAANPRSIPEARPGFVSLGIVGYAFEPDYDAPSAVVFRPDDRVFRTANGPALRVRPLFKEGTFEESPRATNQQVYQGRDFLRQHTAFTGFQFQR